MLMTYGLATTLCCRGLEIKAAYKIWDETESGDHRLAGRKHRYDDLVTEKKMLLAMKDKLLAGGQGPRLASTPTPSLVSRFRQRIILHAAQRPQRNTCQPRPSAV